MDRTKAKEVFDEYTGKYDTGDVNVSLKIAHTYRVAELAERIGRSVGADADFSWFLGLLHDIGRFEQLKRYGTFIDWDSIDHAELGADILFLEHLIDRFPTDDIGIDQWESVAEKVIRLHDKLSLPEDLDPTTRLYAQVLRDADKSDIFRVLSEPPYDERNGRITQMSGTPDAEAARDEVMICVREHRCVPKTFKKRLFETLIASCCLGFELTYPETRKIVKEQGYLDRLMNVPVEDGVMAEQMRILRAEMDEAMSSSAIL